MELEVEVKVGREEKGMLPGTRRGRVEREYWVERRAASDLVDEKEGKR